MTFLDSKQCVEFKPDNTLIIPFFSNLSIYLIFTVPGLAADLGACSHGECYFSILTVSLTVSI